MSDSLDASVGHLVTTLVQTEKDQHILVHGLP